MIVTLDSASSEKEERPTFLCEPESKSTERTNLVDEVNYGPEVLDCIWRWGCSGCGGGSLRAEGEQGCPETAA
jgi:hypothetical protein